MHWRLILACVWLCSVRVQCVTSVQAWDVPVCAQQCRLAASLQSTLHEEREQVQFRHPSRNITIGIDIAPLWKRVDLFFNFHRNFSNVYGSDPS
jgi:hypothetical protein